MAVCTAEMKLCSSQRVVRRTSCRPKLVANGSYGRGTQNDAFLTDSTTPVVPVSSLNGLVVSTSFNAKLTARPTKKVNLAASFKYSDRDNQTAIHIFQYGDAGTVPAANAPRAR